MSYTKENTIRYIKYNTKDLLYYIEKIKECIKEGESPVVWIGQVANYAAKLEKHYTIADMLDLWDDLDFMQIYKEAKNEAKKEIEND